MMIPSHPHFMDYPTSYQLGKKENAIEAERIEIHTYWRRLGLTYETTHPHNKQSLPSYCPRVGSDTKIVTPQLLLILNKMLTIEQDLTTRSVRRRKA